VPVSPVTGLHQSVRVDSEAVEKETRGRTFDSCRQYLDSTSTAERAMAGLYAYWRGKQLSLVSFRLRKGTFPQDRLGTAGSAAYGSSGNRPQSAAARKRRGVTPVELLNIRENWPSVRKPHAVAASGMLIGPESSRCAWAIRRERT